MSRPDPSDPAGGAAADRAARYGAVRAATERLCQPLAVEDHVAQSMPDASPAKWHLAHTSWFFENFLLTPHLSGYRTFHPQFGYLFNSYYEAVGDRQPRPQRGLLTRPTVADTYRYRAHVDGAMRALLEALPDALAPLLDLGLAHEQQHQELIVTDIKHLLAQNPLHPAYDAGAGPAAGAAPAPPLAWLPFEAGLRDLGHDGDGFAFDNEGPRHRVWVPPFRLGSRLVTCGEYLDFIRDGGYATPSLWLSDGWTAVQEQRLHAPLYWQERDGQPWHYTLGGMRPIDPAEPVCHVGFYEADAYARWAGHRLPTEAEWEVAALSTAPVSGHFADRGRLHPAPAPAFADGARPRSSQLFGDCWEWTASPYVPYPGFRPAAGAVGEYNGKFMCNQLVLRGGSCATPPDHIRATYRNFFPPGARWQFSGIRLADEA